MGVDFFGYSNVQCLPVPQKYRTKRVPVSETERKSLHLKLKSVPPEVRGFLLVLHGASYNNFTGELVMPDTVGFPFENSDTEFYEEYEARLELY